MRLKKLLAGAAVSILSAHAPALARDDGASVRLAQEQPKPDQQGKPQQPQRPPQAQPPQRPQPQQQRPQPQQPPQQMPQRPQSPQPPQQPRPQPQQQAPQRPQPPQPQQQQAPQRPQPPQPQQQQAPQRPQPPQPQQQQAPQRAQPPQPQQQQQTPQRPQPPQPQQQQAPQRPQPPQPQQQQAPQRPQPQQQQQQQQPRPDDRARRIDDIRSERREIRQGRQTVIQEGNRTIVREGDRVFIRRNEGDRFRRFDRNAQVQRIGGEIRTTAVGPTGARVVTVTDANGRLIRRSRIVNNREVIIIDNRIRGPRRPDTFFVALPPPIIHIPRERYIVEAEAAPPEYIYGALMAPPVEPLPRRYTLDEIRYSPAIRNRMPRVDLDTITFDSGSWEITPDQYDRLAPIAEGIKRAIAQNPNEVFLIEGHTDAVGNDDDNLSLSDRRAEAASVILTDQFQIPPENLATQGYGEQQLKVPTDAPERANRRVTVRRITPLLQQGAAGTPQ